MLPLVRLGHALIVHIIGVQATHPLASAFDVQSGLELHLLPEYRIREFLSTDPQRLPALVEQGPVQTQFGLSTVNMNGPRFMDRGGLKSRILRLRWCFKPLLGVRPAGNDERDEQRDADDDCRWNPRVFLLAAVTSHFRAEH